VVVNQVGFVVLLALANSSAGAGSLSAYSYAYLFFQLPYGLFAVAVMTAFLPELSQAADAGDNRWFTERFGTGLRLVALVLLPCAVLYVALSSQLVEVLFSRGSFSAASAGLTSEALMVFGASLPGFAVLMYTMRGFYARKDTRTPFLIATGKVAVMVAVAWPLSRLGLGGVVAAFGVAFTLAAVVGLVILGRRTGGIMGAATTSSLARTGLATAVMLAVALVVPRGVAGTGALGALVDLVVVGAVAGGVYLAALAILRSPDLGWAVAQVRSRRRTTSPGPDR
jgi:putative peptidoglycan lipid II flippase